MNCVKSSDPDLLLYIDKKSLNLNLQKTNNIKLRINTSPLLNSQDSLTSFKILMYEVLNGERRFIASQVLVPKEVGQSSVVTMAAGHFTTAIKQVEFDVSRGNLINTYSADIRGTHLDSQVSGAEGMGSNSAECDYTNFDDCQMDYLFSKISFEARPQTQLATSVVKSRGGFYKVSIPLHNLTASAAPGAVSAFNIDGLSDGKSDLSSVFLGNGSGLFNAATTYNTGLGIAALRSNTTGTLNTASGYQSMYFNTTGEQNVADGYKSLYSNSSGFNNTAIGFDTLYSNTTGYNNTAIGFMSSYRNTSGIENTAIGEYSLFNNTVGSYNSAIGAQALANAVGSNVTALGYRAGFGIGFYPSHSNGVFLGYKAAYTISTGSNNIAIGFQAGDSITTGSNNIVIGYNVDVPLGTASNQLNIGNTIYANTSTGNVGIGTNNPVAKLEVSSVIRSTPTDSQGTCSAAIRGGMYFDNSMNEPCFCDGTNWKQFDGGGICR